jgi:DNA-binding NarL/FixJ family response regulator
VSERTEQLLDEIVRLMALSLRQGFESQNEAILAFSQAGLDAPRIAELLGTTPATVRATKHNAAKKPAKKKPSSAPRKAA